VTDGGEWHGQVSDSCGENNRNHNHKTERKETHVPRRVSVTTGFMAAPWNRPGVTS